MFQVLNQTLYSCNASCFCIHLIVLDCGHGAQTYCVRLMTYVHGKTVAESPVTTQDVYHVGKLAATLDKTLEQVSSKIKHFS